MKFVLSALAIVLFTLASFAQPQAISYQAVARDNNGAILVNTTLSIQFTIKQGSANGSTTYQETHAVTSDAVGRISLGIGRGNPVSGVFTTINWGSFPYFLEVELDVNGTGSFTSLGTSEMLSVPYALYAETSGSSVGGGSGSSSSNGNFLVWEFNEAIAYSQFTSTWTATTTTSGDPIDEISSSNGNFLIKEFNEAKAWNQATGQWSIVTTTSGDPIDADTSSAGNFLVQEFDQAVAWNKNTQQWSSITTASGDPIDGIAAANGSFLIWEFNEAIAWSPSTSTWTRITTASGDPIDEITVSGGNFLIYEFNEAIAWNATSGTWTRVTTASGDPIDGILGDED